MKPEKLKVMGCCAGSGAALLFPFLNDERFEILGNLEPRPVFHTPKEEQWRLNFDKIPFIKSFELPDWKPDIIVSSPDCGASSIMRLSKKKKLGKPEKNKTINLVLKAIITYKPQVFLIENLPRLLDFIPKTEFCLRFPGYKLIFHCHSVIEFGNSQKSRKRLVIIGVKRGSKFNRKSFAKIFSINKPKITRKLLELAPSKGNFIPPMDKILAMYDYRKLPKKENLTVAEIYDLWNNDFKDEYKWPIKTRKMKSLPGVYRLKEDTYPMTVRPADRQFRPDGLPLGIQDMRVIMGIPKSFKLYFPEKFKDLVPTSEDKDFLYYLNKARYTLTKGATFEVGKWFYQCIIRS